MKSLHELIVELESWLSHLRRHAETVSQAQVSSAPAESPVVEAAPVEAPKGSGNPILDDYMKNGGNAGTPAGQASDAAARDAASKPATPQVDALGNVTFVEGGVGQNVVINGPTERYSTVPDGFAGKMVFQVGINPGTKYPYSVYLDGELIGTATTDALVAKEIQVSAGERHTLRIDQAPDSSVTAEFRAYRK